MATTIATENSTCATRTIRVRRAPAAGSAVGVAVIVAHPGPAAAARPSAGPAPAAAAGRLPVSTRPRAGPWPSNRAAQPDLTTLLAGCCLVKAPNPRDRPPQASEPATYAAAGQESNPRPS